MNILESLNFSISQCDMADIIDESHRFLLHITLVHIIGNIIGNKHDLFDMDFFKLLAITALAVFAYHIFFKGLFWTKLKKVKKACELPDSDVEATYGTM